MDDRARSFSDALVTMDRVTARALLREAVETVGLLPSVESLVCGAMEQIGRDWEDGQLALSQVYMAGRISEELVDALLPPADPSRRDPPRVGIAVFDDFHMLGKRIVAAVLRSAGYAPMDYGRVDTEGALRRAEEDRLDVLCLSVLMLPSALQIGTFRERLGKAGLPVKLVVGGAPFRLDERLGREVGADAVGRTASDAVRIVRQLTGGAA